MTKFVKTYPRAVVRIARPRPGRNTWGPQWRVWIIGGSDGEVLRDTADCLQEMTVSHRIAALKDAHLDVGILRQAARQTKAKAGAPA